MQFEPALVIAGMVSGAWFFYRLALRKMNRERHEIFHELFANLGFHVALWIILFVGYLAFQKWVGLEDRTSQRVISYIGLMAILWQAIVFVKTSKILITEYLFWGNMRAGVPVLLINLATLLISIFVASWLMTEIFNVRLGPLLATSAVFSLVLGLALQDTLGNLFAGVALQFDKPYEIGHWIEIHNGGQKWIGQVQEISWRATVLIGMGEETLTVPNRVVAQSEISNFSIKNHPIIRSQIFRVPYDQSIDTVKAALLKAIANVPTVRKAPGPLALTWESADSWIAFKLVYFINDYGSQFVIADQVISAVIREFERERIPFATPKVEIIRKDAIA